MIDARREVFLQELAKHGIVRLAARVASPNAKTARGGARAFYELRATDPDFATAWNEAIEEANAGLEREIYRRGAEGFEETRVDSSGKKSVLTRYSDPCLLALARARLPAFRKADVEFSGRVEQGGPDEARMAQAIRSLAQQMANEGADLLRKATEEVLSDQ